MRAASSSNAAPIGDSTAASAQAISVAFAHQSDAVHETAAQPADEL